MFGEIGTSQEETVADLMMKKEITYGELVTAYNYDADAERLHLPEFDFEFVQNGSHLIPVQRGLIITSHPYWNYILSPGRVWQENGDNGYSRAAFPFALVEKNANCTHNGVMTFLFNDSGVSHVYYQITQETCMYFKGNFWGRSRRPTRRGASPTPSKSATTTHRKLPTRCPSSPSPTWRATTLGLI
jgi:hypothetical protein